jgi:hypothetical protein
VGNKNKFNLIWQSNDCDNAGRGEGRATEKIWSKYKKAGQILGAVY